MTKSINAQLVEAALQRRADVTFAKGGLGSLEAALEKRAELLPRLEPYANALDIVNKHITVRPDDIKGASDAYMEIAQRLVNKLHWPIEAIKIFPQGSASTKTLIRSPDRTKFDIDAVCGVTVDEAYTRNPMKFFEDVGKGLDGLVIEAKNRCWKIDTPNKPFYIEFTPSVPIDSVAIDSNGMDRRRLLAPQYRDTALAVVDRKTQQWKPSNPQGLVQWVDDASKFKLVRVVSVEAYDSVEASIEKVPEQQIGIDDPLRIAIRLFKRHRDMYIRRGYIEREFQPISVILVTLVTRMYYGLAELNRSFDHYVLLLVELATLLPHMMLNLPTVGYVVGNPTIEGENFAERWNDDEGERAKTFAKWCGILHSDLLSILATTDRDAIEKKAREVFGCTSESGPAGGGGGGGVPATPANRPPPPPPRGEGLA
ncbi:nucleotidyltransferase [Burkholderia gladioli]|uniref:nucleotidyltransferase domain-containing protein n=1 Tax=Burkholderia gladioli TaxID=28095 RepID=UPI0038B40CF7